MPVTFLHIRSLNHTLQRAMNSAITGVHVQTYDSNFKLSEPHFEAYDKKGDTQTNISSAVIRTVVSAIFA